MIDSTFLIDITGMINGKSTELNYQEKEYKITGTDNVTISFRLRTMIDRRYQKKYNKAEDFYKKIFIIEEYSETNRQRVVEVYPAVELKLLANSVGGKDNLKLGRLVGMHTKRGERDEVIIFYYPLSE